MNIQEDFLGINVFDSNIEDSFMPTINNSFIDNKTKFIKKVCIGSTLFDEINFLISHLKEKIHGINSTLQVIEMNGSISSKTTLKLEDELNDFNKLMNSLHKMKVNGLQLINESEFFSDFYSGLATLCDATISNKNQILKEVKLVTKNYQNDEREEVRKEFFQLEEIYDTINNLIYDLLINCYTMDFREELVTLVKSLNETRIKYIPC